MAIQNRRDLVYSKRCWLFTSRLRLCSAVNRISPLPNYHDRFRTYFARSTILQVALFYRWHFTTFSLLYDLSLEKKKRFRCGMICPKLFKILLYNVIFSCHFTRYRLSECEVLHFVLRTTLVAGRRLVNTILKFSIWLDKRMEPSFTCCQMEPLRQESANCNTRDKIVLPTEEYDLWTMPTIWSPKIKKVFNLRNSALSSLGRKTKHQGLKKFWYAT